MDTIIFVIYTISLISACVCLWVKWDQDENKCKILTLERRQQELEKNIEILAREIRKVGSKSLFKE
jgi:hypothetical protein